MSDDATPPPPEVARPQTGSVRYDGIPRAKPGDVVHADFSGWAQATAIFIGQAMAAGVIGTVTTDALKAAIGRLRRREVSPNPLTPVPDLLLVARTAVNLQCAQLGVDEQAGAEVDAFCVVTPDGLEVLFRARPRGVTASVQLSVDEERADVKAEVRLPEKLFVDREDEEVLRVLRAANGLEPSPPE